MPDNIIESINRVTSRLGLSTTVFNKIDAIDALNTAVALNLIQLNLIDIALGGTGGFTTVAAALADIAANASGGGGSGDVTGPAISVNNDIVLFNGVTGKLIKDSGQTIAQVLASAGDVDGPAGATGNDVAIFDGATGKLIKDSGSTIAAIIAAAIAGSGDVVGPASAVADRIAVFNGTTGKLIKDGGQTIAQVLAAAGDVDGPGSAVSGNLAVFSGTSGKIIADGGAVPTSGILQYGEAIRTAGDVSTSSNIFVDVTGMSVTITTGAHRCIIMAMFNAFNTTALVNNCFTISIDGVDQGAGLGLQFFGQTAGNSYAQNVAFTYISPVLSAASHTFKLRFKSDVAGTVTIRANNTTDAPCYLQITETSLT